MAIEQDIGYDFSNQWFFFNLEKSKFRQMWPPETRVSCTKTRWCSSGTQHLVKPAPRGPGSTNRKSFVSYQMEFSGLRLVLKSFNLSNFGKFPFCVERTCLRQLVLHLFFWLDDLKTAPIWNDTEKSIFVNTMTWVFLNMLNISTFSILNEFQ